MTPEKRLESLRKMVDQRPDDAFARYSLAMALRSAGRPEEAVEAFQALVGQKPDYVPTYLMLGQALEGLGRRGEAARAYRDGITAATRAREDHARSKLAEALERLSAEGE